MAKLSPLIALAVVACGISLDPRAMELGPDDLREVDMYTATFEVACDTCRAVYGVVGRSQTEVVEGSWSGSLYLGTVVEGENVRLFLSVQPFGETWVGNARILVNQRTAAQDQGDEEGDGVTLNVRVGG